MPFFVLFIYLDRHLLLKIKPINIKYMNNSLFTRSSYNRGHQALNNGAEFHGRICIAGTWIHVFSKFKYQIDNKLDDLEKSKRRISSFSLCEMPRYTGNTVDYVSAANVWFASVKPRRNVNYNLL